MYVISVFFPLHLAAWAVILFVVFIPASYQRWTQVDCRAEAGFFWLRPVIGTVYSFLWLSCFVCFVRGVGLAPVVVH